MSARSRILGAVALVLFAAACAPAEDAPMIDSPDVQARVDQYATVRLEADLSHLSADDQVHAGPAGKRRQLFVALAVAFGVAVGEVEEQRDLVRRQPLDAQQMTMLEGEACPGRAHRGGTI